MEDMHNMPHNNEEKNSNSKREDDGFEQSVKRAAMATIGTITEVVEKMADAVGNIANKENIDKMAQKGEETFKQAKDLGASAVKQVKDFGTEAYGKAKSAVNNTDTRSALNDAADSLRDAFEKAREAVCNAIDEDSPDKTSNKLREDLEKDRERIGDFISRLRTAAKEEGEMVSKEMEAMRREALKEKEAVAERTENESTTYSPYDQMPPAK